MTRTIYYTATSLDGFIADPDDSLAWLFAQATADDGPYDYGEFIAGIGAIVMGSTTYEWVRDRLVDSGEAWPYAIPSWVMTHRDLVGIDGCDIRFAAGDVADVHAEIAAVAGDHDVWVVGGGDLAGQLADAGLLDEVIVFLAPVTLGAGRPLFPRRHQLELLEVGRSADFAFARYRVVGPGRWEEEAPS